jgi:CHAT domain-containing protein
LNFEFRLAVLGDLTSLATVYKIQGKIYRSMKQPQLAIEVYNQQLKLGQQIRDISQQTYPLYKIAVIERDRGNFNQAKTHIETVIGIVENTRSKVNSQDLRSSYFATVQDYYKFYIDLLMQLHKKDPSKGYNAEALHISERSRARSLIELLTEARANIRKGVDPQLLAEERRLQSLLEARQKQLLSLSDNKASENQAAALKTEIENLLSQYRELQAKIRTTSPKYANLKYPNPLTLPQIQQQLDKDTLLLQYSLGEERSYLWAVTPNSMQSYELPGRKEIEQKVEELRKLLRDPGMIGVSPEQTAKAAEQLSQLILAPVAKDLGQKRLLIVADGALQYIPFTVLTVPKSSVSAENYQPLLLNHEIVSLPSATTIDILRQELKGRQKAPKSLAILADPVFSNTDKRFTGVTQNRSLKNNDQQSGASQNTSSALDLDKSALTRATRDIDMGNIPRLEGTRKEAEEIMKLVPQSDRLNAFDFDANYTWATNPQLSQYRYLLFATHGILNETNPELSGIVLSQVDKNGNRQQKGFLQLPDLFNLNYPAELLVLSACQTGLGKEVKGEGLVGLTRGLMYAGAARVVVSLWKVDDEATSKLMSEFYKEILQQGKTPAAAMRAAQLKMWKQEEWRNPYSWAAFTLQGEWR